MKKLMTILAVFFCASILLVSCGSKDKSKEENNVVNTPESDAKKSAECVCEAMDLMAKAIEDPTNEDLEKDSEKLEEKCEKILEEMNEKYEGKDNDDTKKYLEALEKEMEKCE